MKTYSTCLRKSLLNTIFIILILSNAQLAQAQGLIAIGQGAQPETVTGYSNLSCFQVTAAQNTESGAVWNITPINIKDGFDFNFHVFLGNYNPNNTDDSGTCGVGADGLCFVLQNQGLTTAQSGGSIGYGGFPGLSLAIELDTYQDAWDPFYNHIAVEYNGQVKHPVGTLAGPVQLSDTGYYVADGKWHTFEVTWDPKIDSISTFFDGVFRVGYNFDLMGGLLNGIFQGADSVFWGFTGGTGAYCNLTQFCTTPEPVIPAQSPIFYGMTYQGYNPDEYSLGFGYGVIYAFNPVNNTEWVAYQFGGYNGINGGGTGGSNDTDGRYPEGKLVYDTINSLFYGLTSKGGTQGEGTIISFDPQTNQENVVWNFGSGTDGTQPAGSLIYYPTNGLFYGLTPYGGSNNYGTIFSFNPATNQDNVVWNFGAFYTDSCDGAYPSGSLVYDPDNGLFYGMTKNGGNSGVGCNINSGIGDGTIFSFDPNTNKEKVVWNFSGPLFGDVSDPFGNDLVYDANNKLFYALVSQGGANLSEIQVSSTNGAGGIISFNPADNTENVLWSFGSSASDGQDPWGDMTFDANNGLFYGVTHLGGQDSMGSIFTFNPGDNSENTLRGFTGAPTDGWLPMFGTLAYDALNGLFYGTTIYGGKNNLEDGYYPFQGYGSIFSFNPVSYDEKLVWSFGSDSDGVYPYGPLTAYTGVYDTSVITSIVAKKSVHPIAIYPNPTNGKINITGLSQGQTVELYNDLGQRINSIKAQDAMLQLDISSEANGIYLVQVLNDDGNMAGQVKVIKIN